MQTPLQVGITGGIGCGKSIIGRIFCSLGIPLYDADSRAKKLMTTDRILVDQIKKEFGILSYNQDGGLNKEHLKQAFKNPQELDKLNRLVHPRVGKDYEDWVRQQTGAKYVIKEAALLFESGSIKSLDKVIVVSAPRQLRMQRVRKRDPHRSEQEIEDIMNSQMDDDAKTKMADYVIVNDETQLVIPQVLQLHERFISVN